MSAGSRARISSARISGPDARRPTIPADTAIIVGAGIGGLTAAVALRRIGCEAMLLERRDGPDALQAGTGLTLWSNAVKALRRIDLGTGIEAVAVPMETFDNRKRTGALISSWSVAEISARVGAPTINLTRANLYRVLAGAVGEHPIRYGADVLGFTESGGRVTVTVADGSPASAGILIGADGIGSRVRRAFTPAALPVYAGYTVWRGLVRFEHPGMPRGAFQQFWGRGMRFCSYFATEQDLCWIAIVNAPEGGVDATGRVRESLVERFRDWVAPIPGVIDATEEAAILRTDIADLRPLAAWGKGRVTLLGDAAHAMTFNVGQGACTAMEDAVVLADRLGRAGDVDAALRSYEAERIKRTRTQQRLARAIGAMGRWRSPVAAESRDRLWHTAINAGGPWLLRRGLSYEA